MHIPKWLRTVAVVAAILLQPVTASAAPEVGWWWNPNESGRGFFIESDEGVIYLAGYFYESDGRATWLVSGGPNADPYTYSGRLLAYRSGQTLFGDYQPPAAPTDAGAVSLNFTDDTHGTITWPGGTIAIERQRFGGATDDVTPDSGWWWNEEESGRGYSVEVQGDSIFIVAFMYDDSGNPVWYYSAGPMDSDSPTTYEGPWLQFANGQTLTGPYKPPTPPVPVGQLSVEFTGIDEATFEFDDLAPATTRVRPAAAIRPVVIVVTPEIHKATPTYVRASKYAGVFNWKAVSVFVNAVNDIKITTTVTAVVTGNLVWNEDEIPALGDGFRTPFDSYTLGGDSSPTLTWTQTQVGAGTSCQAAFSEALHDDGSRLKVNAYAEYVGTIKVAQPSTTSVDLACKFPDGSVGHNQVAVLFQPQFAINGMAKKAALTKKLKPSHPSPEITITGNWTFAAIAP
jgi:hypothetical protein